jgi:hypothetical protein
MSVHQQPVTAEGSADDAPRLFGRYLLTERLSRGGMGELFLARHGLSGFEKRIVIKKILPHLAADEEFLNRFIDEAQVAVSLAHANIAQVFEVGRVDDEYFLAIEHVDGRDLRATLAALITAGRRMPPAIALFIAREIASGLAYAHRRTDAEGNSLSLVHCDISPPNVMLSYEGEIKIIDFGIARRAQRLSQTDPSRGFGKFGYMSPEQLMRGATVDHRTDLYAVGVLLFEMLSGRRLFPVGGNPDYPALARQVVRGEHPLPGEVDPALARFDELTQRALAPHVQDRFQSAAALRDAIQAELNAIDPTFNGDRVAAFMAGVFGEGETGAQRGALDVRALVRWQRELTEGSVATVSYARASLEPRAGVVPEPPAHVADGTPSQPSQRLTLAHAEESPRPSSRRLARVALGLLTSVALAGAAIAGAHVGSGGADAVDLAGLASRAAGTATPVKVPPSTPRPPELAPVVEPLPVALVASASAKAPAATGGSGAAPELPPRESRHDRRERPTGYGDADPQSVEARFRAAHREYQVFKSRYGTRLEAAWNDLAHFATFARTPDKRRELDRRIRELQRQMAAAQ